MRVKICGITQLEQAKAITDLGADTLGFIHVPQSPRHVSLAQIAAMVEELPPAVSKVGVVVNLELNYLEILVKATGLTGIQLHGEENPNFCGQLRDLFPDLEIIKAIRLQDRQSLGAVANYCDCIDTLVLDAYHPSQHGGTGQTLQWDSLVQFRPCKPWLLAGGLNPDNILTALAKVNPDGIDLSSGVESSPGKKDLNQVAKLFEQLNKLKLQ